MKKQLRPDEPQVLQDNSVKWNARWVSLRAKNPVARFSWYKFDKRSARDWILTVLREMNQGHCSFCDAFPLEASTNEPIEHFRPKSKPEFYHLAYSWSNLFYSCPFCQSQKLETWNDLLIAPDDCNYVFHDYFMFDFTTGAISENPKAPQEMQERARCTIDLYGLDSDPRRRYRLVEQDKWKKSVNRDDNAWAYRDFVNPPGLVLTTHVQLD